MRDYSLYEVAVKQRVRKACGETEVHFYTFLTWSIERFMVRFWVDGDDYDNNDLQWVRVLKFQMHLGLTERSFVSHVLISAQESRVTLPQFQMALGFKY
jgi:hypothetical protein